jgi:hypothetical protein
VTGAAGNTVDGVSSLTAEEFAALLDSNLTQQLSAIEQQLLDLGFTDDDDDAADEAEDDADDAADEAEDDADDAADEAEDDADDAADEAEDDADED